MYVSIHPPPANSPLCSVELITWMAPSKGKVKIHFIKKSSFLLSNINPYAGVWWKQTHGYNYLTLIQNSSTWSGQLDNCLWPHGNYLFDLMIYWLMFTLMWSFPHVTLSFNASPQSCTVITSWLMFWISLNCKLYHGPLNELPVRSLMATALAVFPSA